MNLHVKQKGSRSSCSSQLSSIPGSAKLTHYIWHQSVQRRIDPTPPNFDRRYCSFCMFLFQNACRLGPFSPAPPSCGCSQSPWHAGFSQTRLSPQFCTGSRQRSWALTKDVKKNHLTIAGMLTREQNTLLSLTASCGKTYQFRQALG